MASGYDINANPVPLLTTFEMSLTPRLCARLPRIAKMVNPAKRLVNVSKVVTITASL